jgi:DNA (cytosine-5)-methyltransferase 1
MADDQLQQRQGGATSDNEARGRDEEPATLAGYNGNNTTHPTNGHWRDADWLGCRDGKFRPVEPDTFPLVDGAAARVGRLRGYGNAIVAQVAQTFIKATQGW